MSYQQRRNVLSFNLSVNLDAICSLLFLYFLHKLYINLVFTLST